MPRSCLWVSVSVHVSGLDRVCMCVYMPGILEVLICHFYKISAGADFMQRMSTCQLTEPAEFLFP